MNPRTITIITHAYPPSVIPENFKSIFKSIIEKATKDISLEFKKAEGNFLTALNSWDGNKSIDNLYLETENYPDTTNIRVLISLIPEDSRVEIYRKTFPSHAEWGGSNGFYAISYAPIECTLSTLIHESLHFFDVDDCYAADRPGFPPKDTCDNSNCLMRYGNNTSIVCETVLNQIRNFGLS